MSGWEQGPPRVPGYRILRLLGDGSQAFVYEAEQLKTGRRVALKVLRQGTASDPHALRMFQREGRAAERLNHPNIVRTYEFGQAGSAFYLAMDLLPGPSLKDLLAQRAKLHPRDAIAIIDGILRALEHAHSRHVIHRDVKPGNILLSASRTAILTDFGIAHLSDGTRSVTQGGIGTPAYMAPEQFTEQRIGPAADLYATGVVLFELLTGQRPFNGSPVAVSYKHQYEAPPTIAVPSLASVNRVVQIALAKDPAQRFDGRASRMRAELLRALPANIAPRATAETSRDKVYLGLQIALILTATAFVFAIALWLTGPPIRRESGTSGGGSSGISEVSQSLTSPSPLRPVTTPTPSLSSLTSRATPTPTPSATVLDPTPYSTPVATLSRIELLPVLAPAREPMPSPSRASTPATTPTPIVLVAVPQPPVRPPAAPTRSPGLMPTIISAPTPPTPTPGGVVLITPPTPPEPTIAPDPTRSATPVEPTPPALVAAGSAISTRTPTPAPEIIRKDQEMKLRAQLCQHARAGRWIEAAKSLDNAGTDLTPLPGRSVARLYRNASRESLCGSQRACDLEEGKRLSGRAMQFESAEKFITAWDTQLKKFRDCETEWEIGLKFLCRAAELGPQPVRECTTQ